MFTNNFAGLIGINCQNNSSNYGVCKYVDNSVAAVSYSWFKTMLSGTSLKLKKESNSSTGIALVLGTGSTPPKSTDTALESLTEDYEFVTQTKDIPFSFSSSIVTITRVIKNMGSAPLTISEIGLYAYQVNFGTLMLAREVIEPVTLEPGEKHSFTMDICVQ